MIWWAILIYAIIGVLASTYMTARFGYHSLWDTIKAFLFWPIILLALIVFAGLIHD